MALLQTAALINDASAVRRRILLTSVAGLYVDSDAVALPRPRIYKGMTKKRFTSTVVPFRLFSRLLSLGYLKMTSRNS